MTNIKKAIGLIALCALIVQPLCYAELPATTTSQFMQILQSHTTPTITVPSSHNSGSGSSESSGTSFRKAALQNQPRSYGTFSDSSAPRTVHVPGTSENSMQTFYPGTGSRIYSSYDLTFGSNSMDKFNQIQLNSAVQTFQATHNGQMPSMDITTHSGTVISDVPVVDGLDSIENPTPGQYAIDNGVLYQYELDYDPETNEPVHVWNDEGTMHFQHQAPAGATIDAATRDATITSPSGEVTRYDDVPIVEGAPPDAQAGDVVLVSTIAYKCCYPDNRLYTTYRYEADGTWTNMTTEQQGIESPGQDYLLDYESRPDAVNTVEVQGTLHLENGDEIDYVPIITLNRDECILSVDTNIPAGPDVYVIYNQSGSTQFEAWYFPYFYGDAAWPKSYRNDYISLADGSGPGYFMTATFSEE